MNKTATILTCLLGVIFLSAIAVAKPPRASVKYGPGKWASSRPSSCPFEPSKEITGLEWTGRMQTYTDADTWYPSWAADGNLYSPWTDGVVNGMRCYSVPGPLKTGNAVITGEDPMKLTVTPLGVIKALAEPYQGRYPCGSLVYKGVWYYATYALDKATYQWDTLGPMVGFRVSKDFGKTWTETPLTPAKPLFGESGKNGGKIKMGTPHVVDFGRDMQHSPDGKMYLVGHGATRKDAPCTWVSGDQIYMARVTPSPENINDISKYEFFAGHDAKGQPIWAKDFSQIKPLLEWNERLGCVTITYNAPLKKYLLCTTNGGITGEGTFDTTILEADAITGPYRLIAHLPAFGAQAYFLNFPSKFISPDGRTLWLWYSANWQHKLPADPPGSRYALCVVELKLLK
ncbi:MAG: hypothetical protein ABFD85_08035 [Phycisphaerae bacterium]